MGLCASMLRRKAKKRHPEPRRGMPKALFVVRGDRRQSKPEALVFRSQDSGRSHLGQQKPGKAPEDSRRHERCGYGCTGLGALELDRRLCAQMPRLPCGSTRSVAVEPVALAPLPARCNRNTMAGDQGAPAPAAGRCGTPMTPVSTPMTPLRPVWQRRILMGMRCELPRFSGVILYDEHGRPLPSGTPGRRNHHQGKRKAARTSTTTTLRTSYSNLPLVERLK